MEAEVVVEMVAEVAEVVVHHRGRMEERQHREGSGCWCQPDVHTWDGRRWRVSRGRDRRRAAERKKAA